MKNHETYAGAVWRRFCRHRLALASLAVLVLICGSAVLAPVIAPYDPEAIVGPFGAPPGGEFLLGTDQIGRDMLSRLLYAARTSLFAGVLATLIATALGVFLGLLAGYFGGLADILIMRFTDMVMSFPYILLVLVAAAIFKPGLWSIILILGFVDWPGIARLVRGNVLSLRETNFACEVKNFNGTDYIDRKELRKMDLYTQYAIAAAKEAVEDSGMDLEKEDLNRIGVIYGVGIGGIHTFEEEVANYTLNKDTVGPKFNPFFIPKMIADIASGQISIMYGFHGPNFTTTSACASSSNAIADAFNYIRLGKANVIVAGGAEAAIFEAGLGGFNAMHALSTRNDDPERASRPFSASRDGFVMGEGAGCLILEELEHAKARGAKIYAELAGVGASADAYHLTASHPEGLGAKLVMLNALEDAELKPEDIDYINVHGTSTPVGDVSEVKAIKDVFGDHAYKLNISSTKSMTGHLLGAAGAVEAIASVLAVKNDIVPPTINHEEGDNDENIDYNLNFTFNEAQKRTVNAALSNTFGFGGHNACVIVKKYAE